MSDLSENIYVRLKSVLTRKTVLLGIGNTLRGDDSFGPELIRRLAGTSLVCIDAGTTPENQIGVIARHNPEYLLIADAVHLDMEPGSCMILEKGDIIRYSGLTTHDLSPVMFMDHLQARTGALILMLAVQPQNLEFGSSISKSVNKTLQKLELIFKHALKEL